MLYQVDTAELASLVRTKRGGQNFQEAAEEITKSVGTLLRADARLEPALANVLAIMVDTTYLQLAAHE